MSKRNKYCIYCGTKNEYKNEKCTKCKKKMNPKYSEFLGYLKSKIKDKYLGDIEDNAVSIITNYIKSHLYGTILTCAIIATSSIGLVFASQDNFIKKVDEKPTVIFKKEYAGVGLSSSDVAKKYVEAIIKDDIVTVKNLQLSTFYPEITGKEMPEIAIDDFTQIETHHIIDNKEILFKHGNFVSVIPDRFTLVPRGIYDGHPFQRYVAQIEYCSNNNCENLSRGYLRELIEIIEVNGNHYVSGEDIVKNKDIIDDSVCREMIFSSGGNTENLNFNNVGECSNYLEWIDLN